MGRQPQPALSPVRRRAHRAPSPVRRLVPLALVAVLAAGAGVVATAGTAAAQSADTTESWDVQVTINPDGSVDVAEDIVQVFEEPNRHGIERRLAIRQGTDDPDLDRLYTLSEVGVTSPSGAPADLAERDQGGYRVLRIGDPDETVSGRQEYRLQYRYEDVMNSFVTHEELYWNVIGPEWAQPVGNYSVTVEAPVPLVAAQCFAGPAGTDTRCASEAIEGERARWAGDDLPAGTGIVTVVAALPTGSVTVTPAVLVERTDTGPSWHGLPASGARLPLALAVAAAIVAGLVALVWRQGRDRAMAGSVVDSAFASDVGAEGVPVPLRGGQDPTVQFEPPDGIRPAQLGLIIDERVNASDVSATIVDLAVRGYLTIEELREERALFGHRTDWKLTRTARAAGDLLGYERLLLDGLFEDGDVVELDDLKQRFSERYGRVRSAIYDDALQRRWFPAHPDRIRTAGRVAGVLVAALAVAGIVWCVTTNSWGLLLVPVAAGGLALAVLAGWLPRRSPVGRGVYRAPPASGPSSSAPRCARPTSPSGAGCSASTSPTRWRSAPSGCGASGSPACRPSSSAWRRGGSAPATSAPAASTAAGSATPSAASARRCRRPCPPPPGPPGAAGSAAAGSQGAVAAGVAAAAGDGGPWRPGGAGHSRQPGARALHARVDPEGRVEQP